MLATVSVKEAGDLTRLGERFIRRLIQERRIPFHRVGRKVRLRPEDLRAFIDAGRQEVQWEFAGRTGGRL
jgi:excisionase family DNA binding protein